MLAFAFVSMQAHQRRTMHATKAMAGEALSPQPVRTNTNTSVRDCAPRARAHCGPSLSLAGGRWRLRARAPPIHCAPAPPKCNTARKCLGLQLQASLYFAAAERNEQSARLHRERRAQEAAQRLQEVEAAAAAARLRHAAREQERRAQQAAHSQQQAEDEAEAARLQHAAREQERRAQQAAHIQQQAEDEAEAARLRHAAREQERRAQEAAHRQQQVEDAAVAARQCDAARRRRERRVAMLQQRDQRRREEQQRRAERVQDRARERDRRYGALLWRTPLSCAWQCFVNTTWIHAAEAT
jgi:hypothetical protein